MKKKILNIFFAFVFVFASGIVFSACGTKDFDVSKINIGETTVTYDGYSHVFGVDYDENEVYASVSYSEDKDGEFKFFKEVDFVDAGTYSVYYKLSAKGYNDYISDEPITFTINQRQVNLKVNDVEWMMSDGEITSINPQYQTDGLVAGHDLSLKFAIGKNIETEEDYDWDNVSCGDKFDLVVSYDNPNYALSVNNPKIIMMDYVGVYDSNGKSIGYTHTLAEAYTLLDTDSTIKLHHDIKSKQFTYAGDIVLKAETKNYRFTLDLNGYVVDSELDFVNYVSPGVYTSFGIDVTIVDSSKKKTGKIGGTQNDYGVLVKGNNKVKVSLEGVDIQGKQGGIYSNGLCEGATITAQNCNFFGVGVNVDGGTVGAYLAAKYVYRFTNCYFEGETGYYTKSGSHELMGCHFVGIRGKYNGEEYNGNGCESTGSAVVVDSTIGYLQPMSVAMTSCEFDSVVGYCIEVFSTTTPGADEVSYAEVSVAKANYVTYGQDKPVFAENEGVITGVSDGELHKGYE